MAKKALILHAMGQSSKGHWYPWLKSELEKKGYEVWVPDLPNPDMPSSREVVDMLLESDWDFEDSLIIGHSSGSVQLAYLVQELSKSSVVRAAVMVSSFDHPLPGMEEDHSKLFVEELDAEKVKHGAKNRLFVHAKDDPWCPLSGPQSLSKLFDADLVVLEEGKHFSTSLDPKFTHFPELMAILQERNLL